jgi:hypothetical protein
MVEQGDAENSGALNEETDSLFMGIPRESIAELGPGELLMIALSLTGMSSDEIRLLRFRDSDVVKLALSKLGPVFKGKCLKDVLVGMTSHDAHRVKTHGPQSSPKIDR